MGGTISQELKCTEQRTSKNIATEGSNFLVKSPNSVANVGALSQELKCTDQLASKNITAEGSNFLVKSPNSVAQVGTLTQELKCTEQLTRKNITTDSQEPYQDFKCTEQPTNLSFLPSSRDDSIFSSSQENTFHNPSSPMKLKHDLQHVSCILNDSDLVNYSRGSV